MAAVLLVSLASLGYEVLLTRIFSFSQWNHLSFMVISIVMFGCAASGSALSLAEGASPGRIRAAGRSLPLLCLAYGLAAAGSYLLLRVIPLDYFRLAVEPVQGVWLLAVYLALLAPFALAGAVTGLALAGHPERAGLIYGASLLGSAAGAASAALLLPLLGEARLALALALLPSVVPVAQSVVRRRFRLALLGAVALGAAVAAVGAPWVEGLEPQPSAYKLLAQALQFPEVRLTRTERTLRARVDELETPYLRFAPGLSLTYTGALPERRLLVRDGDELFALPELDDPQALQFARYSHAYAAYELVAGGQGGVDVLVLLQGGGLSLAAAAAAGAQRVTVLVEPAAVARALRQTRHEAAPRLEVRQGGLRLGLQRGPGQSPERSPERNPGHLAGYDVVQIEAWGPSVPGIAALSEEPLLTVEALQACLVAASPRGIVSVSRRLLLPPSDCLRLFAAAAEALRRLGAGDPLRHLLALRGWDSHTLLFSPQPFSAAQVAGLRRFCGERNFDPLFWDGLPEEEANRYNRFAEPYHYRELQALANAVREGLTERWLRERDLDLRPSTDDRPYHNRYIRWTRIGALYRATGRRLYSLLLSGEVIVLAVLAVALPLGAVLLVVPALASRQREGRGPSRGGTGPQPGLRPGLYFLASGAGYLFLEMGLIQTLTAVVGSAVVALTGVLSVLLVLSGAGGALLSAPAAAGAEGRRSAAAALALTACTGALAALAGAARASLLRGAPGVAVPAAALLAAAAGVLAGVPFPAGLARLEAGPAARARAWAANGVASVLASILSLPLAMSLGISRLFVAAALCYALVAGVSWGWRRGRLPVRGSVHPA